MSRRKADGRPCLVPALADNITQAVARPALSFCNGVGIKYRHQTKLIGWCLLCLSRLACTCEAERSQHHGRLVLRDAVLIDCPSHLNVP